MAAGSTRAWGACFIVVITAICDVTGRRSWPVFKLHVEEICGDYMFVFRGDISRLWNYCNVDGLVPRATLSTIFQFNFLFLPGERRLQTRRKYF